jgi:hypothetical protein
VKAAVLFGIAGMMVAWAVSLALPKRYVASGVVRMGTRDAAAAQRILSNALKDVTRRTSLSDIIMKEGLYDRERHQQPMEDVVMQMQRDTHVTMLESSPGVYRVQFFYRGPAPALHVARELMDRMAGNHQRGGDRCAAATQAAVQPESSGAGGDGTCRRHTSGSDRGVGSRPAPQTGLKTRRRRIPKMLQSHGTPWAPALA